MDAQPVAEDRRTPDPKIAELADHVASLQTKYGELSAKVDENTAITRQVLDGINAFKLLGTIAKWTAAIAGALTALWTLGDQVWTYWHKLKH